MGCEKMRVDSKIWIGSLEQKVEGKKINDSKDQGGISYLWAYYHRKTAWKSTIMRGLSKPSLIKKS